MTIISQQIIISGLGGQGVLFVTRILAEAAIRKGLRVLTSETHGMAQRGGTVVSHLKVGDYASPLIRPGLADGLIALKEETYRQYEPFLKPDGWAVVNSKGSVSERPSVYCLDSDAIAKKTGAAKSVNLILLGYALAMAERADICLFCTKDDIKAAAESISADKIRQSPVTAIEYGYARS